MQTPRRVTNWDATDFVMQVLVCEDCKQDLPVTLGATMAMSVTCSCGAVWELERAPLPSPPELPDWLFR